MPTNDLLKLMDMDLEETPSPGGVEVDTTLQDWQMEALYPQEFRRLQEEQAREVKPSKDTNFALDFAGNLVWSLGKSISLGALDVADIAAEGSMAEAMGSQPWEFESGAGRAGAAIGEGIGFMAGLGIISKGVSKGAKALGIGAKALQTGGGKKIATEASEALSTLVGDGSKAVSTEFTETLFKHGRKVIDDSDVLFKPRKADKLSFEDAFDLRESANKNFDDMFDATIKNSTELKADQVANLLDPANKTLRNEIRDASMKAAQEYTPGNMHKVMQVKASQWGLGPKMAQITSNMAYEGLLLGLHGGAGTFARNWTANAMEVSNNDYERTTFAHDVIHGRAMGLGFGLVRFTPGGARTMVNPLKGLAGLQSGMMANMKQVGQAVAGKWKRGHVKWNEAAGTIEGK